MEGIAIGAAANLSSETTEGILREIKRHVRYVIIYKQIVEKLQLKMELLIAKRKSVQLQVDVAIMNLEKIRADVELWCERVDKTIDEEMKKLKDFEDKAKAKCLAGLCFNIKYRYQISKKAEEVTAILDELLLQGQFDRVAVPVIPQAAMNVALQVLTISRLLIGFWRV